MAFLYLTSVARSVVSIHPVCTNLNGRTFVTVSAGRGNARTSLSFVQSRKGSSQAELAPEVHQGAPAPPLDTAKLDRGLPPFSDLKGRISYDTLKAITEKPFRLTDMSPVQAQVLPLLPQLAEPYHAGSLEDSDGARRQPRDLLVKAKTGTGKTLAFLVPAVEARLKAIEAHGKQAVRDAGLSSDKPLEGRVRRIFVRDQVGTLIISPTRELATQIANEALKLTHHHRDFEVRLLVGGVSKRQQMREWMKGRRDIVVSTPGRLRDLLTSEQEVIRGISKTKQLVLDEADTLLDMGFREDIEAITRCLPKTPQRQTFLFSATVSGAIRQIAQQTLDRNHTFINVESHAASPVHTHVPQYHTVLQSASDQLPHVLRLLAHDQLTNPGKSKVMVFLPTTRMTQFYTTLLRELSKTCLPSGRHTNIYEIHSKRTQEARTRASAAFRRDNFGASILVTSDISARGIDYPGVSRVIQVGIPSGTDQYIHRIGRTGRANGEGRGDLVLLPWESSFVTWQLTDIPLKPLTLDELKLQVDELAKNHDSDPQAFFSASTKNRFRQENVPVVVRAGYPPVSPILQDLEGSIRDLFQHIDEEAVNETFVTLIGYYVARAAELRLHDKNIIVEGCKDWAVQACGLSVPPYLSESFRQKLGISDPLTKRRTSGYHRKNSSESHWIGRGSVRDRKPRNMRNSTDSEYDDRGRQSDFRSQRYGDSSRSSRDSGFRSSSPRVFGSGGYNRGGGSGHAFGSGGEGGPGNFRGGREHVGSRFGIRR